MAVPVCAVLPWQVLLQYNHLASSSTIHIHTHFLCVLFLALFGFLVKCIILMLNFKQLHH
jgi:hypothetical protein